MPPRQIIWDWNGTLLDDVELCIDIMNGMLAEERLALRLTRETYHAVFDFPIHAYYTRLGFDLSGDHFARLARRFIDEYDARARQCSLHVGARAHLERLRRRGVSQSILTAARTETVRGLVEHHGIADLLDAVIGLDNDHAHSKIEVGQRWFADHGVDPGEALLIGDTVHDHEVARALGVRCQLVAHGHHDRARLEACGCEVVSGVFSPGEAGR